MREPAISILRSPDSFSASILGANQPSIVDERLYWRWISIGMITVAVALSGIITYNLTTRYAGHTNARQAAKLQAVSAAPVTPATSPDQSAIAQADRVQQLLATNIGANPISAMVINLKTGQTSAVNADRQFVAASIYKLFVATAVYKQIDAGKLTYTSAVSGSDYSVAQCLDRMITVSDNDCGQALGTLVGWESQNPLLIDLGFTGTQLSGSHDELTTAHDTSLLFKRLYDGTLLSPNSSTHFLELLKAQKINNRVPAALPAGTVVAHKTGDLNALVHDAGIVYSPAGDYVVTFLSGSWSNIGAAVPALANLSATVYGAINQSTQP